MTEEEMQELHDTYNAFLKSRQVWEIRLKTEVAGIAQAAKNIIRNHSFDSDTFIVSANGGCMVEGWIPKIFVFTGVRKEESIPRKIKECIEELWKLNFFSFEFIYLEDMLVPSELCQQLI